MMLTDAQRVYAELALAKVETMARHYKKRWRSAEVDELVAVGNEAAAHAALRFDPERHPEFDAFAYLRIRGAMHDHLRESLRHASLEERIVHRVVQRDEPAETVPEDVFADFHKPDSLSPREAVVFGLERNVAGLVAGFIAEGAAAEAKGDLEEQLHLRRQVAELQEALARLGDPDRAVVQGFYFESKTLDELAVEVGISKRTVQRIHARAKDWLAARLKAAAKSRLTHSQHPTREPGSA